MVLDRIQAPDWGAMLLHLMHRSDGKIERLARLELLEGCSRKALSAAARLVDFVQVEPGTVLVREGMTAGQVVWVSCGKVSVSREGQEVHVAGKGAVFGEMAALGRLPYSETAVSLSYAEVAVIEARDYPSLLNTEPCLALKVLERAVRQPQPSPEICKSGT